MNIRLARPEDIEAIWEIFFPTIESGDTYVYGPETQKDDLARLWMADQMYTYVMEENGKIVGTYFLRPNFPGRGSHVANAGYMVHPDFRGRGIGKTLCTHSLEEARILGFKSLQFNLVVSTNQSAIHLWKKFGFQIIGTLPKAFQHRELGLVDAHIMYLEL